METSSHRVLEALPMIAWRVAAAIVVVAIYVVTHGCASPAEAGEPATATEAAAQERRGPQVERCTGRVVQTPPVSPWLCSDGEPPRRHSVAVASPSSEGSSSGASGAALRDESSPPEPRP